MEKTLHIITPIYAKLKMNRKNGPIPGWNRAVFPLQSNCQKKYFPEILKNPT
jgi:hypothetical protein